MEKRELLRDIRAVLACHESCSISSYPASDELLSFFDVCARSRTQATPSVRKGEVEQRKSSSVVPPGTTGRVHRKIDHGVLTDIAGEVAQCKSCSLSENRTVSTAGRGGGGGSIRLMIVGHWLPVQDTRSSSSVFGSDEDRMVERMLTAINLRENEVFISNVIKCGVAPAVQPQAEHIDACLSYLQRQIAALVPEIICTMGMVPTRTLLRFSQPLSKLRGSFYDYKAADGLTIPLLPTYHPGYLLQNPEMKAATWKDLQAIQQRLG